MLGVLVHVLVGLQTENQARHEALSRLDGTVKAYIAGTPLGRGAALDPAGLPPELHDMARRGERGTQLGRHNGDPTMWAVAPANGKALAVRQDYSRHAASLRGLDQAIIGSAAVALVLTLTAGLYTASGLTRRLRRTAHVARRISTGTAGRPPSLPVVCPAGLSLRLPLSSGFVRHARNYPRKLRISTVTGVVFPLLQQ
ncbi:hypothetical protein ABR737_26985 [Streptomyces sp. Edi2]|uniref:hypothetical protein n=1 Tax=Streptomyces sp. Edi2 TaxID=3162528 RepID=UPI0033058EC9